AVTLGVELEVVDQRLHGALHFATLGRHDLAVGVGYRPDAILAEQPLHTLAHDFCRLAHLFHADQIAVVAIAVLPHGDVEVHLRIALVGLALAQIPRRTRAAHHHARKA